MKTLWLSVIVVILWCKPCWAQTNIGIGTTTPHTSAVLEIAASNKGLLIPRVTEANRPASPATGLLIYQTNNTPGFYFYNGSAWQMLGGGSSQWVTTGSHIYYNSGNVGIGSSDPSGAKLEVRTNSTVNAPQVLLSETNAGNFARQSFTNTGQNSYWTLAGLNTSFAANDRFNVYHSAGGDIMTFTGNGRVGIGAGSPTERLHVEGAIRFNGALMPNNVPGSAGQILQSNGAGNTPSWVNPMASFASTLQSHNMTGPNLPLSPSSNYINIPGLSRTINMTSAGKVLVTFNVSISFPLCIICDMQYYNVAVFVNGVQQRNYMYSNTNGLSNISSTLWIDVQSGINNITIAFRSDGPATHTIRQPNTYMQTTFFLN